MAAEMDDAKSRDLAAWMQEKIGEGQEVPESRIMSMRWVLTWKPPDMSTHKAEKRRPELWFWVFSTQEVTELQVASPTLSVAWKNAHASMGIVQSCVLMPSLRSCRAMERRCKKPKMCTPELLGEIACDPWNPQ